MKEHCEKCGKKARLTCPALDAPLCSRCCGTGRGVSIDCTPECSVNPFGLVGYNRYQEIDTTLIRKLFKAMARDGYDERRMISESKRFVLILDGNDPFETGAFGAMQDWIFHQRDADGLTRFQRWAAAGWTAYSNDEQQILHMRQGTELTLIELLSVEGDHMTRVKDLLDPAGKEHVIFDYSLVQSFVAYQVMFAHITTLRHFSRIEANAAPVEPSHARDLVAFIREQSGSSDASEQKAWLRLHAPVVAEKHESLVSAERERLISSVDLTESTTVYQSDRTPDQWADFLEGHSEFEEDTEYDEEDAMEALYGPVCYCFVWQRQAGASGAPRPVMQRIRVRGPGDQVQALAMVYVHKDHICLTGLDRKLMDWLLDRWSSEIAPGLVVETEGVRDLKNSSGSPEIRSTAASRESQPPLAILEDPVDAEFVDRSPDEERGAKSDSAVAMMRDHEERHLRRLIDETVPALGGKTPREASKSDDPALQKLFEQWAKSMIYHQARNAGEHGYLPEVFWFYEELNLAHLWPADWPR